MTILEQELSSVAQRAGTYLTVGVFDGVHAGHRSLFDLLKREAQQAGCQPGVVTFRNHPRTVLSPETVIPMLTPIEEKTRLLQELGISVIAPITFTLEVSEVLAEEFVELLHKHLRMKGLVVGPDFALGHNRQGTPDFLQALGKKRGFTVTVADFYLQGGTRVSSTLVREALAMGDLATVSRCLGRHFSIVGVVVHGEGRGGRELGFPTANLGVEPNQAIPRDGIYAAWAYVEGIRYRAATNVGVRPTFGRSNPRTIEPYLLDFSGDLYGKSLRLEFVKRLRDELPFTSTEALMKQIARDVEDTRRVLA